MKTVLTLLLFAVSCSQVFAQGGPTQDERQAKSNVTGTANGAGQASALCGSAKGLCDFEKGNVIQTPYSEWDQSTKDQYNIWIAAADAEYDDIQITVTLALGEQTIGGEQAALGDAQWNQGNFAAAVPFYQSASSYYTNAMIDFNAAKDRYDALAETYETIAQFYTNNTPPF